MQAKARWSELIADGCVCVRVRVLRDMVRKGKDGKRRLARGCVEVVRRLVLSPVGWFERFVCPAVVGC